MCTNVKFQKVTCKSAHPSVYVGLQCSGKLADKVNDWEKMDYCVYVNMYITLKYVGLST